MEDYFIERWERLLRDKISKGVIVYSNEFMRAIGKTKVLSDIAKENDYKVFVYNRKLADILNERENTDVFFWCDPLKLAGRKEKFLIDDICDTDTLLTLLKNDNLVGGVHSNFIIEKDIVDKRLDVEYTELEILEIVKASKHLSEVGNIDIVEAVKKSLSILKGLEPSIKIIDKR